MGIGSKITGRQALALGAAVLLIAGAGALIFFQLRGESTIGSGTYFTVDEGKTLFVDKSTRLPPFDRNGQQAVRAHVFECGGKRVVGYLSRYTESAKKALDEASKYAGTGKAPPNVDQLANLGRTGLEVKRPGDAQWVSQADARRATLIRVFKCPDGSTPSEVYP